MTAMFDEWRQLRGVKEVTPANVAAFVREIGHLGIDIVWDQVQAVARSHFMRGLADPTLSEPVAVALNQISRITPPRTWPKAYHLAFLMLPLELQRWLVDAEEKRSLEVRRLQTELDIQRKSNVQESSTAAPAAA